MATADEVDANRSDNRIKVDAEGRFILPSSEDRRRLGDAARAALARMALIENGPDEDDRDFFRALDESNPGRFDLARFYTDGPDPA